MRRSAVILAAAMLLVTMLTASAAPAMADGKNNDTRLDRKDLRADRHLLREFNNDNDFRFFRPAFFGFNQLDDEFEFDEEDDNDFDIDTFTVGTLPCFATEEDDNGDVFCLRNGFPIRIT